MLIATWNVNSIRTRLPQIEGWLKEASPNLLCIQETKVENSLFPKDFFENLGYKVSFHGQKSYNGVAIISTENLDDVKIGLSSEISNDNEITKLDQQARIISALVQGIRVINVYVPNGSNLGSEKYNFKIAWLKSLNSYLKSVSSRDEDICLLGDFNIALQDKDMHNPQTNKDVIMASKLERELLQIILNESYLEDVFRVFETETNNWSWWDYRNSCWERNKGWRIDHIYLSESLIHNSKGCLIHKELRGNTQPSDHVPVSVELQWPKEDFEDFEDFENF